jgi:predicted alpha/beta superfamily hydrolase
MRASTLTTFLFAALLALGPSAAAATTPDCTSTVQGDLRVHMLDSAIFGNTRAIRVLLPAGYDVPENADRRYPVLYLLDGQNVFDACLSEVSRQEWGADEAVQQLVEAGRIPPMIVVGVDHAGRDRAREYLPYKDFVGGPDMDEPAGRQFPDFMVREVMPLVDGRYRTLQGWEHTGIGGSSYGGVASLYALLARPNTFGYGLIESPVLWIGMGQLVRDTSPLVAMPRRVFMAFGGREAADPAVSRKMIGLVRQVESHFHAAGYDASTLRVVIDEDARHDEAAWRQRLPGALEFLFGK